MRKIITFALTVILVFSFSACSNETTTGYEVKISTEMRDDGWFYYLYNEQSLNSDERGYVQYGAYNLKYKHIEGYEIPIKDSETGEILEYASSSLPYLHITPNETLQKELNTLNEYLNEFEQGKPLNESDLLHLNLTEINDADVVRQYNEMNSSAAEKKGKYTYLPEASIEQDFVLNGYQWQVGYFISFGNIKCVRIDIVIDESDYLSDIYNRNEATEQQKKMYENIMQIEKEIIHNQNFEVQIETKNDELYSTNRLLNILKKINTPIE